MNVYTMPGVADMSMVWMGAGAGPGVGSVGGGSGPMGDDGASQTDLLGIGGYAPHHQDNPCDLLLDSNPHDSPSYYTTSSHHSAASNQSLDDMTHMHHSPLAPLEGLGDIHLDPHHNHHLSHPYSNDGTDDEDTSSYQENNLLQPHMMDTATQTAPCPAGGRKIKPVKHPGLVLKTPIAYERDTDPAVIPIVKDGIGTQDAIWDCGEMAEPDGFASPLQKANPCAEGSHVIYAWARDADPLKLPDDVGFQVGIGTEITYLVLQVHYSKAFKQDQYDSSGIELLYTDQRRSKLAGVLLLATGGSIRPHSDTHMEAVCQLKENKTIHPFAYRTHTHSLGKIVAGYKVHKHPYTGFDTWTLLGKRDPLTPQMFYPIFSKDPIRYGDKVAARCTMHSDRDISTHVGPTNNDEMCNFYLMYYVDEEAGGPLDMKYCINLGPPYYYWGDIDEQLNNIPDEEASML